MQTRISNSLLIGAILGVITFGYVTDMISRRAGLLFTSFLVTISTLMATLALQVPSSNMLWFFVIVRGICGFGVGGKYPPSAAAGLEESDDVRRKNAHLVRSESKKLMFTVCAPLPRANLHLFHNIDGYARFAYTNDYIPDMSESKQQQSARYFSCSLLHRDYPSSHNYGSPVFHG